MAFALEPIVQDHRRNGHIAEIGDVEPLDLLALKAQSMWAGAVLDVGITAEPAAGCRHIDELRLEQLQELRRFVDPVFDVNGRSAALAAGVVMPTIGLQLSYAPRRFASSSAGQQ